MSQKQELEQATKSCKFQGLHGPSYTVTDDRRSKYYARSMSYSVEFEVPAPDDEANMYALGNADERIVALFKRLGDTGVLVPSKIDVMRGRWERSNHVDVFVVFEVRSAKPSLIVEEETIHAQAPGPDIIIELVTHGLDEALAWGVEHHEHARRVRDAKIIAGHYREALTKKAKDAIKYNEAREALNEELRARQLQELADASEEIKRTGGTFGDGYQADPRAVAAALKALGELLSHVASTWRIGSSDVVIKSEDVE